MSLINQMLQDLEARRSDISGGEAHGQQIRAVPPRRGVHPAWWACLALAMVSAGLLAWLLLRPAPEPVPEIHLPLRLDGRMPVLAPPQELPPAPMAPSPSPVAEAVPPVVPAVDPPVAAPAVVPVPAILPSAPAEPRAAPAKVEAAVAPRAEPIAPPQPEAKPAGVRHAAVSTAPVLVGAKQVKEFTPQQRAENEYRKALNLLQQGRPSEAQAALEQTLQLDGRHAGARQALIGVLLDGSRRDEALRHAREGLALDESQTGLAMIAARLQLERGELRPAIETLERTLPHAAEQADYLAFLAALLQRAERHRHAVEQYAKALQKAPQNGLWWMGMGISLQAEQRNPEATEAFRRARSSGSLSPELQAFVEGRLVQLR